MQIDPKMTKVKTDGRIYAEKIHDRVYLLLGFLTTMYHREPRLLFYNPVAFQYCSFHIDVNPTLPTPNILVYRSMCKASPKTMVEFIADDRYEILDIHELQNFKYQDLIHVIRTHTQKDLQVLTQAEFKILLQEGSFMAQVFDTLRAMHPCQNPIPPEERLGGIIEEIVRAMEPHQPVWAQKYAQKFEIIF